MFFIYIFGRLTDIRRGGPSIGSLGMIRNFSKAHRIEGKKIILDQNNNSGRNIENNRELLTQE